VSSEEWAETRSIYASALENDSFKALLDRVKSMQLEADENNDNNDNYHQSLGNKESQDSSSEDEVDPYRELESYNKNDLYSKPVEKGGAPPLSSSSVQYIESDSGGDNLDLDIQHESGLKPVPTFKEIDESTPPPGFRDIDIDEVSQRLIATLGLENTFSESFGMSPHMLLAANPNPEFQQEELSTAQLQQVHNAHQSDLSFGAHIAQAATRAQASDEYYTIQESAVIAHWVAWAKWSMQYNAD